VWLWRVLLVVLSLVRCPTICRCCCCQLRCAHFFGSDSPDALTRVPTYTVIPYLRPSVPRVLHGHSILRGWTNILTAALSMS